MLRMKKFVAGISTAAIFVTSMGLTPVVGIADEDVPAAKVTDFRQMRCNNTKTGTSSQTGETYYASGYLINYLDGKYMSTYNADADLAEYGTKKSGELKTSAREYALMRIQLNKDVESVNVQFEVRDKGKTISAYTVSGADWTSIPMTDFNHVPTSQAAVDTTYAVSKASGHDWSMKDFEFEEKTAESSDTSEDDKLIDLDLDVSDEENEQGYKDIMVMNSTSDDDNTHIMVGEPTVTAVLKSEPTETPEPTTEPTSIPTATPEPEQTAEPTSTPTATPEQTSEPTQKPTAEPIPDGAIIVSKMASNISKTQTVTVDEYGNTRDAAYTTDNSSIWYLGTYDLDEVDINKITMRLGLVGKYSGEELVATPQVKLAYMTVDDDTVIDSDYITNNSSKIRDKKNIIGIVEGLTEPEKDKLNGHKYLGALYEVSKDGVKKSAEDTYSKYPGGTAMVGSNSSKLDINASGKTAIFVYGTAQNCRAAIDYIMIESENKSEPTPTAEPTSVPTATPEQTTEPTSTPTAKPEPTTEPTQKPTAEPIPDGAITISKMASNVSKTQTVTVDEYGNTRDTAYTTDNNSIWYVGTYDLDKVDINKITMRLGLVGKYSGEELVTTPQVKLAYMSVDDDTVIDSDYITNNSSKIRDKKNIIGIVEGLTEPEKDKLNGHKYLGALYEVSKDGVKKSAEDTYSKYPGGTATIGSNSSKLDVNTSGKTAIFVYGTAQSCRAAIDYVIVDTSEKGEATPTPNPSEPTPTPNPSEPTPTPTPTPSADPSYPDGAVAIKDRPNNAGDRTTEFKINSAGKKRAGAYTTNDTSVWYIGDYDLSEIDNIELRMSLVPQFKDGNVNTPQVRLAYLPLDGSNIDSQYIADNNSAIRASSQIIAMVDGATLPSANEASGHEYLGALYKINAEGVTVDSDGYAAYPGGTASISASTALKVPTDKDGNGLGKVAVFIYATAASKRAVFDYAVFNKKVLTPTSLEVEGDDTWVIYENSDSDYTTAAEAYKAKLISDLGTEMSYNDSDISWSVSGSDYISMKNPNGSDSIMQAEKSLPIGETNIVLTAVYSKDGKTLTASKNIKVDKRQASVPSSISVSGDERIEILAADLPKEYQYSAEVKDQFDTVMKDAEIEWSISGDDTEEISIDNTGKLTVGANATSTAITVTAASKTKPDVKVSKNVEIVISKYPANIYPSADVLFRSGNTDSKNVNGPDIEVRNLEDSDRGFSGGLKFDISSIRSAVEANAPINSIKLRLTTSVSNDGKLILKELSNDWDESDSTSNSFDAKKEIVNAAINAEVKVVNNDNDGVFTLGRQTKGKRIYDGARGDNETLANWQTTLDITDYVLNKIKTTSDNEMSLLLMTNYNGTASNTIFSKDINSSNFTNWSLLVSKFPEVKSQPSELYPVLLADYAAETVTITAKVDRVSIPSNEKNNSTKLSAVHYNPFTEKSDENILWSISGFIDEDGNASSADGISVNADGTLTVSKNAKAGTVTVKAVSAENKVVTSQIQIRIIKLSDELKNGSFEKSTKAIMPYNWTANDPSITDGHNGVQHYEMDQASENVMANFNKTDTDGYFTGTHSAADPTGVYGNKTVKITAAHGIDKDYDGKIYTNNAGNSANDGGPDLRVTSDVSYWLTQDYHLDNFYQLNSSAVVGPYVGYEGFKGTTGKSSAFSGNFYIKDGTASAAYTTDGYDTLTKLITVPQDVDRLRINWGLTGSEGSVYYRNFNLAPQGLDDTKSAPDGKYALKVTNNMTWTSDAVTVEEGQNYTYKLSAVNENKSAALAKLVFKNTDGETVEEMPIAFDANGAWTEKTGETTAPEGAVYAEFVLTNSNGSGSVWYDNVIFTKTTEPKASYISITGGNDFAVAPLDGETANVYDYTAKISDQYNNSYNGEIVWSLDKEYTGISIRSNGTLVVDSSAEKGSVVIRAAAKENSDVYDEKTVSIVKKSADAGKAELENGDFSKLDENGMPQSWTNDGRTISIANGSFDTSITGWKTNYTTYSSSDTSALIDWDNTVDHTGNNGGSARIYNADRAQGSLQISQNTSVIGGNTYDISVWVKTDHVSSDSNVYATLISYDKNGSTVEENKNALVLTPEGDPGESYTKDWTKLSTSVHLSDLTTKLRIDMRYRGGANNQNGTVWFDDLTILKQTGIDSSQSYNGSNALKLSGYGEENEDISRGYGEKWVSNPINGITAGTEYIFSADTKTFNATKGAYLTVTYYDSLGRALKSDKSEYAVSTEWTNIKNISTAPENAAYAVAGICIDGQGLAWFANAKFNANSAEAAGLSISGADNVEAPSTNTYKAVVTDASGTENSNLDIKITAQCPDGISFDSETGILTVTDKAAAGSVVKLRAEYNGMTAEKTVTVIDAVTAVKISGSASVTIPSSGTKTAVYTLTNQKGQTLDASKAKWSVSGTGVTIDGGKLVVSSSAGVKTVVITAEYNGLKAEFNVKLTKTTANTGSGGSGGGGGGGSISGTVTVNPGISTGTADNTVMGNFGINTGNTSDGNTNGGNMTDGTSIIPQPDPSYFTQGMENIGGFSDIAGVAWAQKAIVALHAVNIVNGKEEGKFFPNDNITRAEFVKMLIGTLEYAKRIDTSNTNCNFSDVADDVWYHDAVAIAVNNGIVTGVSENEFAPDALITRQDMAVMISRAAQAAQLNIPSGAELVFTDNTEISDYASQAVAEMSRAKIITGFEDGTFSPKTNATRAQAVVMIYRAVGGTD